MDFIRMNENDTGMNTEKCYISEDGFFTLARDWNIADICISLNDYDGVMIAAKALTKDIKLVTGKLPSLKNKLGKGQIVLAGTIGHNEWIDSLISEGRLEVSGISGKWETYVMETIDKPFQGVEKALVIAGSDKRGSIYGIYKLSELIGVSAWVWWADSYPKKRVELLIADGRIETKEPSVQYRGIFINDENPCFGNWCKEKFGGVNAKMYVHVFELILRLKGNYLWPAMWGKSFNLDDPDNPKRADAYGIVMGTSHHEPMMRAHNEWTQLGNLYGGHENWNYSRNKEGLYRFWEDRIRENKDYEKIVTVGMRGDGDESMIENGTVDEIIKLYENIINDQREILAKHIHLDVTNIPQVWCLYKEVEEFYTAGMKVYDDITLMLCDDNFGNVRHLPVADKERKDGSQQMLRSRKGGYGMYYHFDYVGDPYSYKWINNMPLQKTWEQMTMAYEYGVRKIWIVNVGDLKPMEFPTEYFLTLAYDIDKWGQKNKTREFTYQWARKEFGEEFADDVAEILRRYTKYNGRRKPESLLPSIYHPQNYNEADRVLEGYQQAVDLAESVFVHLPRCKKDSFYQLVLYPIKASYMINQLHICTARNRLCAAQGRNSANYFAGKVNDSFVKDWLMAQYYNQKMSAGKWKNMMTQAHIGQTTWRSAEVNMIPKLSLVTPVNGTRIFVVLPGSQEIVQEGTFDLPDFIDIDDSRYTITVASGGEAPAAYYVKTDEEWILMRKKLEYGQGERFVTGVISGVAEMDCNIEIAVDWDKVPMEKTAGAVSICSTGVSVTVHVYAVRADVSGLPAKTFVDTQGVVTMEAEHYAENVSLGGGTWEVIDDYGRTLSSMKVFPVTLDVRMPGVDAPYLEYRFATKETGEITAYAYAAPTNSLTPDTGMKYAIAVDDEKPQIVDTFPKDTEVGFDEIWRNGVMDNCRITSTKHLLKQAQVHTLRIYMVDAGYVLQRVVIDCNHSLKESYLGPEESYCVE
jgi:hypothetical protein